MAKELEHLIQDLKRRRDALDGQINDLENGKTTTELIDKLRELRGRAEQTAGRSIGPDDETLRLRRR
ncbi:MAG TPA: hypothetical protein VMS98_16295 [Thermoanaerobaculia bacterium]|nr:hypothetical protein [Thermoanaerobaculia bacterium]